MRTTLPDPALLRPDREVRELLDAAAALWCHYYPPTYEQAHGGIPTSANEFLFAAEEACSLAMRAATPDPPRRRPTRKRDPVRQTAAHRRLHRLMERDGPVCTYCATEVGCPCRPDLPSAVADHVLPRSRGGADHDENRAIACWPCNSSKGDQTPDEWGGRR